MQYRRLGLECEQHVGTEKKKKVLLILEAAQRRYELKNSNLDSDETRAK